MDAYCERQGKSIESLRFLYDGERIRPEQTPEDVRLNDYDIWRAFVDADIRSLVARNGGQRLDRRHGAAGRRSILKCFLSYYFIYVKSHVLASA